MDDSGGIFEGLCFGGCLQKQDYGHFAASTVATLICSQAHTDLNKVGGPQRVVRSMPSFKLQAKQTCSDTTSNALSVCLAFIH